MVRIAAIVINFNTPGLTERSIRSLLQAPEVVAIHLLDNGSARNSIETLEAVCALDRRITLHLSATNLGFAGGCNLAFDALTDTPCDAFLLLNSDAFLRPEGIAALLSVYRPERGIDLCGGRILKPDGSLDSRGIAYYVSCLASNRQRNSETLFGPTAACALYSRALIESLKAVHGYVFDDRYFCYAEDTDLAARALLLGYKPGYTDEVVAVHEGQASSGGAFNNFILYHGIRNSIWVAVKCLPAALLVLLAPVAIVMYCAIAVRHCRGGSAAVARQLYFDAARELPRIIAKRWVTQRARKIGAFEFLGYLTKSFYEREYLARALRELFGRRQ